MGIFVNSSVAYSTASVLMLREMDVPNLWAILQLLLMLSDFDYCERVGAYRRRPRAPTSSYSHWWCPHNLRQKSYLRFRQIFSDKSLKSNVSPIHDDGTRRSSEPVWR